jgi:hypothetical protein
LRRWKSIVRGLRKRRAATSRFVRPSAAESSVGAAHAVVAKLPPGMASALHPTVGDAFTDGMGVGLLLAAVLAAVSAVVVARLLPARDPLPAERAGGSDAADPGRGAARARVAGRVGSRRRESRRS